MIDNIADPSQSRVIKKSDLLYFWRDLYNPNIIIIVTRKRSRHHTSRPYSASVFRLRAVESAQVFLQKAQQFFAQLSTSTSTSNILNSNGHVPSEKSSRTDRSSTSNSKTRSKTNRLSVHEPIAIPVSIDPPQSSSTITPIRRITRAEFDPGKSRVHVEEVHPPPVKTRRTISETTTSSESQGTSSTKEVLSFTKKLNDNDDDDDDKMTTISNYLSGENVTELLRELKELRHEIAALKIDKRTSAHTRSISTSPLLNYSKQTRESSTTTASPSFQEMCAVAEVDAETQTDFRSTNTRRRTLMKKNKKTMIGSSTVLKLNTSTSSQISSDNVRRSTSSSSTNTGSEHEGIKMTDEMIIESSFL